MEWFTGADIDGPAIFEPAFAPRFTRIDPHGTVADRSATLEALRRARGLHAADRFQICIENVQMLHAAGPLAVAVYEEWQEIGGLITARRSTVILEEVESGALRWLHVHETWIPTASPG